MAQPTTSNTTKQASAKPKPKAKARAKSKSAKAKRALATRWHDGETPIEELDPHERMAHEIVVQFRDLAPSVERIMDADLTDDQRLHALSAFNASLAEVGDPNRDPRTAIESALAQ